MNTDTLESLRKSAVSLRRSLCADYEKSILNIVTVSAAVVQLSECVETMLLLEMERRREKP